MTPLDGVILIFHQLSIFFCNQIRLGFGGVGNFHLKPRNPKILHRLKISRDTWLSRSWNVHQRAQKKKVKYNIRNKNFISIKILIQFVNSLGYNSNEFLVIAGIKNPTTLDDNLISAESNTSNTSDSSNYTSDTNDDDATTSKTIVELPVDMNHMIDNSSKM